MNEPASDETLRALLERDDTRTSTRHDEAVLTAARALAAGRAASARPSGAQGGDTAHRPDSDAAHRHVAGRRSRRWLIPLGLAASFAAGVLITRATLSVYSAAPAAVAPALVMPLDTTRSGGDRTIPVEQARPDDWYRYIQELIAAGKTQEAERHLRRFNELHPDYVYQP
jgi:hypothetical protein